MRAQPEAVPTGRLTLAPLGPAHAEPLFAALRDPEIYRYIPLEPPRTASDLEARYRRMSQGPPAPEERWWNWAVSLARAPAEPLGTVELSLAGSGAVAHLAYMFGRAAWGYGYAFEACNAALAYAFAHAGTRAVDAYVDTRNARSIRLAERLGMHCVETVIGADYFKGSASDEHHFRLTPAAEKEHDAKNKRR